MESESLENNNNVTKVNIRHEPETDLKRKDENHKHIPLQLKPSLSDDDQDILTSSVGSSEISDTSNKTKTKTKVDLDIVDSDSDDRKSNHTQKYGNSPELKEKPDNQNPPEDISGSRAKVKVKSIDGSNEPSDNDSEPEGEYSFTEDQKRAMMELMVQKHEEGDIIDEDPPEYNVKGRLLILNAELANDPIPDEGQRETRVVFKPEIVDLVAPPPSYLSDDEESQPNSARGDKLLPSPDTEDQKDHVTKKETDKAPTADQYVVERDGNFTVLSSKELTPAEYELYAKPNKNEDDKNAREHSDSNKKSRNANAISHDHSSSTAVVPKPPSRPRPNTAAPTTRRKTVQSTRPKSAAQNFNNSEYNSPYALSKEQKEQVKKEAKRLEEERHEKEKRRKEEEEEKQKENMSAYDAWIQKKEEEEEENRKKKQEKKDDNKEAAAAAYQSWLKDKRSQGKKEKLLRRRQQQERNEDLIIHTPEDCDKAFREWLKKKNLEMKKQNASEKQKYKFYKLYLRRSRRSYALLKALKEVQSSPYLDYYGYRF